MPWIKRNLYFLAGGGIAIVLLGLSGYYCYSKWNLNNESQQQLDTAYHEWSRIISESPSPGNDKVDNIKLAQQQEEQVRDEISRLNKLFVPIPPIPNVPENQVTGLGFATELRRTVEQLTRRAQSASVTLPPKYDFSFEAQRTLVRFAPGSLGPLSIQLGDIKDICDVLFKAKINSLDSVQRESVSTDDQQSGNQADYLPPDITSVTNELAVLRPYQVTFHCFSGELGDVMSGLANENHGIIIKVINVEPGNAAGTNMIYGEEGIPNSYPTYRRGTYFRQMRPMNSPEDVYRRNAMENQYRQNPNPYPGMQPPGAYPGTPGVRGGLPTVLDESQLKVTLLLDIAKLLPKK